MYICHLAFMKSYLIPPKKCVDGGIIFYWRCYTNLSEWIWVQSISSAKRYFFLFPICSNTFDFIFISNTNPLQPRQGGYFFGQKRGILIAINDILLSKMKMINNIHSWQILSIRRVFYFGQICYNKIANSRFFYLIGVFFATKFVKIWLPEENIEHTPNRAPAPWQGCFIAWKSAIIGLSHFKLLKILPRRISKEYFCYFRNLQ